MEIADVRDIAIVTLATVSIVTVIVLIITAALLWRLIGVIRREVQPILKSAASTAASIQGITSAAENSSTGTVVKTVIAAGRARKRASFLRFGRK